jgi:hypothetical protein
VAPGEETDDSEADDVGLADDSAADVLLERGDQV